MVIWVKENVWKSKANFFSLHPSQLLFTLIFALLSFLPPSPLSCSLPFSFPPSDHDLANSAFAVWWDREQLQRKRVIGCGKWCWWSFESCDVVVVCSSEAVLTQEMVLLSKFVWCVCVCNVTCYFYMWLRAWAALGHRMFAYDSLNCIYLLCGILM